jgi:hypothetical protein
MENKTIGGILTVGQLRAILANMADHEQITIATDSWWLNVESVDTPDHENGNASVIFYTADTYDTRQH